MPAPCLPAPDACRKAFTVLVLWESFSSTGRKAAYFPRNVSRKAAHSPNKINIAPKNDNQE